MNSERREAQELCRHALVPPAGHTDARHVRVRVAQHFDSRYCSKRIRLSTPPSDLTAYRDELLQLATQPDVKAIVPVRECDIYLFAKYRNAFDRHVTFVSPPLETLAKAHDRL